MRTSVGSWLLFGMLGMAAAQEAVSPADPLPPLKDRLPAAILDPTGREWEAKKERFTAYESDTRPSWRYCHDGRRLIVPPFFSCGTTGTRHKLVQTPTLKEALADIAARRLRISAEQQEQIDRLIELYPDDAK